MMQAGAMQLKTVRRAVMGVMVAAMAAAPVMAQTAGQTEPQPTSQSGAPVHDASAVTLKGGPDSGQHSWTSEQLVTSTVHEAWIPKRAE